MTIKSVHTSDVVRARSARSRPGRRRRHSLHPRETDAAAAKQVVAQLASPVRGTDELGGGGPPCYGPASGWVGHGSGGAVLCQGPGDDRPSPQRVRSTSITGPRGWQLWQCLACTPEPRLSGSGCSFSTARAARSCIASARVLGSSLPKGHARADRSPTSGATGTTTGGRLARLPRWRGPGGTGGLEVAVQGGATDPEHVGDLGQRGTRLGMRVACSVLASVITVGRPRPDLAVGPRRARPWSVPGSDLVRTRPGIRGSRTPAAPGGGGVDGLL